MLGAATLEGAKLRMADAPMDATTVQVFVVGMVVVGRRGLPHGEVSSSGFW